MTLVHRPEYLQLPYWSRVLYYAPLAMCGFITLICLALLCVAGFVADRGQAAALAVVGGLGIAVSVALGIAAFKLQRGELRYHVYNLPYPAEHAYQRVRAMMSVAQWQVMLEEKDRRLDAETADFLLEHAELVSVRFLRREVWIASICDPRVGFSLAGKRRCAHHREKIRQML
jgi:hypothetical protein